jgi:hypothetical protein
VGPVDGLSIAQPAAAAISRATGEMAIYSRGKLIFLAPNAQDDYDLRGELELEGEERRPAVLAFGGSTLLVGRHDGRVLVIDGPSRTVRSEFRPEGANAPRFVCASDAGRWFAIVFHNGQLWLYDAQSNTIRQAGTPHQGSISTAHFSGDEHLNVAHGHVYLSRYQVDPWQLERTLSPRLGILTTAYRYGLVPLYTIFPKPGELDRTFEYLLSGKETKGEDGEDLTSAQEVVDPWTPLWSSALFMVVVLIAACVYIERQEF